MLPNKSAAENNTIERRNIAIPISKKLNPNRIPAMPINFFPTPLILEYRSIRIEINVPSTTLAPLTRPITKNDAPVRKNNMLTNCWDPKPKPTLSKISLAIREKPFPFGSLSEAPSTSASTSLAIIHLTSYFIYKPF